MTIPKIAFLAWIISLNIAHAEDGHHMVYGPGIELCSASLKHDWIADGEAAWIAGYMSFATELSPVKELDPWHTDAKTLISLVYRQCKSKPSLTISDAASIITSRILNRQNKENSKTQEEDNPNESLERAPL